MVFVLMILLELIEGTFVTMFLIPFMRNMFYKDCWIVIYNLFLQSFLQSFLLKRVYKHVVEIKNPDMYLVKTHLLCHNYLKWISNSNSLIDGDNF